MISPASPAMRLLSLAAHLGEPNPWVASTRPLAARNRVGEDLGLLRRGGEPRIDTLWRWLRIGHRLRRCAITGRALEAHRLTDVVVVRGRRGRIERIASRGTARTTQSTASTTSSCIAAGFAKNTSRRRAPVPCHLRVGPPPGHARVTFRRWTPDPRVRDPKLDSRTVVWVLTERVATCNRL